MPRRDGGGDARWRSASYKAAWNACAITIKASLVAFLAKCDHGRGQTEPLERDMRLAARGRRGNAADGPHRGADGTPPFHPADRTPGDATRVPAGRPGARPHEARHVPTGTYMGGNQWQHALQASIA
ncbi:hypothetical protein GCM10009090_15930 [[Pseudomonas] boreopolis]|uniref:Uncharacterized protein n=1 Tax=Xanthomonas boreopolis TaxID=86183 RepID=A0A919F7A5_9XANT|nr:hypothetical protein GCM10009090_15930 [[Pseudomonas] boreopolis]